MSTHGPERSRSRGSPTSPNAPATRPRSSSSDEDIAWAPKSYFDMMAFLFDQQAHNEGKPMQLDGKAAHVVDALEALGTFSGGTESGGDFPMFFFDLEHASVFGRITY
jgi:hypothetical protein